MEYNTIYTLNSRDNTRLEIIKSIFELNDHQMFNEINNSFKLFLDVLSSKKIDYNNLKNTLIPNQNRNEGVFVFDSLKIESLWYGYKIFEQIIPVFEKSSNHSVLCGDYISNYIKQERLYQEFQKSLIPIRAYDYSYSNQFFMVYVNNLSNQMVSSYREKLFNYNPYIGFIDLNFSSFMKAYLSTILCSCFIKHKNIIIMGHADDISNDENINITGYPFEEHGYVCKSIQSMMFDTFLSYKIERPIFESNSSDILMSINAITSNVYEIKNFKILIEDEKLKYLLKEKGKKLKKAGLYNCSKTELVKQIKNKIDSNYIYNLRCLENSGTFLFNIIVEINTEDTGEVVKLTLALEYIPKEKLLRLITVF